MTVDGETLQTPINVSTSRFISHTVTTKNFYSSDYIFKGWENGQKDLTRDVSLDFETGDLELTAYYALKPQDPTDPSNPNNNQTTDPTIPYIFEDGFEDGLANWDGIIVTNGEDPAMSTSVMNSGDRSVSFKTYPTFDDAESLVFKTVSTSDVIYTRTYVSILTGPSSLQKDDRFYLMRIVYGETKNVLASVGIRRNGTDQPRWCLITAKNSSDTRTPIYGEYVDMEELSDASTWTSIELYYNKTEGVVEVWVNGEKQISSVVTPGDMSSVSNVQFGVFKKGDDGLPPPTSTYTVNAYLDDCVIDDEYIGP